jgi:uncharacterized DUF497 family protein
MLKLVFDWNETKSASNAKKHGVTFDEAQSVFYDENAIQFFDPEHSEEEDRFILLGTSFKSKTVVVCHCFKEEETKVRIISARKADKDEQQAYWSER